MNEWRRSIMRHESLRVDASLQYLALATIKKFYLLAYGGHIDFRAIGKWKYRVGAYL